MKERQIRRDLGKYLKKLREDRKMTLLEVSAYLQMLRIECSHANLCRIEGSKQAPRADIIAGLSIVYDLNSDTILFRASTQKNSAK